MSHEGDRIPPMGTVSQAERMLRTRWVATLERSRGGAPLVWPRFVARQGRSVRIIDVREADELVGPVGLAKGLPSYDVVFGAHGAFHVEAVGMVS